MRHLFVYILILLNINFASVSYAQNDIQQPISPGNINPETIFKLYGHDRINNGLDPVEPYQEYGTDNKPWRTPIAFDTLPCQGGKVGSGCHFPTNKWYTDLIFKASSVADDQGRVSPEFFRVAQSPYTIQLFDDLYYNDAGKTTLIQIPGIYISVNDPYLVVNADIQPSPAHFFNDTYVSTLQISSAYDFALTTPIDLNNPRNPPNNFTRKILDAGQLHLTTQWADPSGQQKLTTWLVRGSPYITAKYENMPVTLFETDNSGFVIMASDDKDKGEPFIINRDLDKAKQGIPGQVFRFVVIGSHEAMGSYESKDKYPYRYVSYMLFASEPITLVYSPVSPGIPYQLLYSKETPANVTVRVAYVGSGPAYPPGSPNYDNLDNAMDYVYNNIIINGNFADIELMLENYANTYPTGATINLDSNDTAGKIVFNWNTQQLNPSNTKTQLLMMGFKATHKKNNLSTEITQPAEVVNSTYNPNTIRGKMFPIIGKTWTLNVPYADDLLDKNLFFGKSIPDGYGPELLASLQTDASLLIDPYAPGTNGNTLLPTVTNDSYGFGKRIARLARLVVLADQLKDQETKNKFLDPLKKYLSYWFDGGLPNNADVVGGIQNYFVYDNRFGGVITARASFNQKENTACLDPKDSSKTICGYDQDFYSGQFTDHHFHFGYFIYAAAVLGKNDPDWLNKYKDKVDLLVRDIANPSEQDVYFTPYRHFDWFEGHAYANGLVPGGSGRNQESTSEGLNAWYGIALWGDVTGRGFLKDIGRIMAAQEILAAQQWTQITPGKDNVYYDYVAKAGSKNNVFTTDIKMTDGLVTGINWANKVDHGTFFGAHLSYMTGIQLLPYTPISSALLAGEWLPTVKNIFLSNVMEERINLLNRYSNFPDVIQTFGGEWSSYANPKDPKDPNKTPSIFWGFLQSFPKDTYQWLLVNTLALAPVDADTAYSWFAQNGVKGKIYIALVQGQSSFMGTAEKQEVVKYFKECPADENGNRPDACVKSSLDDIWYPTVIPYFNPDYSIIDSGMSVTNSLWWIFTHKSSPLPIGGLYWPGVINIDTILANAVTISWLPVKSPPSDADSISYTVTISGGSQKLANKCTGTSKTTCQISGLNPLTPYLLTVQASDLSVNRGNLIKQIRIYTPDTNIKYAIKWEGDIQHTISEDKKSVILDWPEAKLEGGSPSDPIPTLRYNPQVFEAGSSTPLESPCGTSTSTTCKVDGLKANVTYYAKVTASADSKAQEFPKQTPPFKTDSTISWDPNVTAIGDSDNLSAMISWNAVNNAAPPIQYVADVKNGAGQQAASCTATDVTTCTVNQLSPDSYSVTVKASSNDWSQTSDPALFTINSKAPTLTWDTQGIPSVNLNGQQVSINWAPGAELKNGGNLTIQYNLNLPGTGGCTSNTITNCTFDVSGLTKPGNYTGTITATAGDNLKVNGPSFTVSIPAHDHPTFTVCRRTTVRIMYVNFSAPVSGIKAWVINNSDSLNAQMVSSTKYQIALPANISAATSLTITYSDDTTATQPIIPSSTCQ
jgi:hypothetical protein